MSNTAPNSVKIKICGIFRKEDTAAVNKALPDFVDFVFYKKSHRYIDFNQAKKLRELTDPKIKTVGVFVDEPPKNVIELFKAKTIDIAQLHGKEDELYIEKLKAAANLPVIKAKSSFANFQPEKNADCFLFDSANPISVGGSGKSFDWNSIPEVNKPFFLAGGLNAENVIDAINKVSPYAVDVSSGVETDGHKDCRKITEFVNIVRKHNL